VVTIFADAATAARNGVAWVHGSAGGFVDSIEVTVHQAPRFITLRAATDGLPGGGGSVLILHTVYDARGTPVEGAIFSWSTDNPGVINVDSTGLVTAPGWGKATITARVDSISAVMHLATTGGTPPAIQSLYAAYLVSQQMVLVTADVIDAQGDAQNYVVLMSDQVTYRDWNGFLQHGTALQPADRLLQHVTRLYSGVYLVTGDESANETQASIEADTASHSQAPSLVAVTSFRIGADSLRVDFTAQDNELDAVEVWLVGLVDGNDVHPAPLFVRFALAPTATAQFSGSVGLRSNAVINQLGVVLRDATGAFSPVVAVPPVVQ
jgi:hypothetical protein